MTIAEQIASFLKRTKLKDIPEEACTLAKEVILDCLGVAVCGFREPASQLIIKYISSLGCRPQATIIAQGLQTACGEAALANATMAHALDYDDISDTIGGHPSVVILPAVLAVGQYLKASGQRVLEAYIKGFEVEAKLATLVNFEHYDKGWHPTATLGVFGSAAACAVLLELDEERTATALSMATSMASGIKENFGSMTKPLQAGMASHNGVRAAMLAQNGFTAKKSAFEGKQGFFNVYNGPGKYRIENLEKMFGNPWDLISPGLAVKQYPCCGSTHPVIDAVIYLADQYDLSPEEIARIQVAVHPRRLAHTNRPNPLTSLEAKFSLQYVTAIAATKRWVGLEDFCADRLHEKEIQKMLAKIEAISLPQERWGSEHFAAEVDIACKDGRSLHHRVEKAKGRGPQLFLTEKELERKFLDCTTQLLRLETAQECMMIIKELESIANIGMLMDLFTVRHQMI